MFIYVLVSCLQINFFAQAHFLKSSQKRYTVNFSCVQISMLRKLPYGLAYGYTLVQYSLVSPVM